MFVVECKNVHVEDNTYKVTNSLCGNVLIGTFVKEETASLSSFIVRDVGVQWRDVKCDKYGIVRKSVEISKFVKEISSVFNVGWYGTNYGLEVKINKLKDAFSRVIVGRNYGPSRIVNFVTFGENVKSSGSRVSLYKILFSFFVYEFVVEHAFDVFCDLSLYSVSLVVILLFVEGGIVQLSVALVYVPGSVH